MKHSCLAAIVTALLPAAASAGETVTYKYDARGRLVTVSHAGGVNNGVTSTYAYDRADNRTEHQLTGVVPRVVVVPLDGYQVIPIL